MPMIDVNGLPTHYEDTGEGDQTVVFSHGLLWSARMWQAQVEHLRDRYRCIAYDHPGQGRSAGPDRPQIGMETCYQTAVGLIETLGLGPVHFVGMSQGGFTGMRVAARRPDLVASLALFDTSAQAEPRGNLPRYSALLTAWKAGMKKLIAGQVMPIQFGRTFLDDPARAPDRERWQNELLRNTRDIDRAVQGVIKRDDFTPELGRITAPTLVVVGEEDVATPPDKSRHLADGIAGARLEHLPATGHSSPIERPADVNRLLDGFLDEHAG